MNDEKGKLIVSPTIMAKTLGISDRQIRNLADEGILIKSGRGKYNLIESVSNYINNLKAAKDVKANKPSEIDWDYEKAKHEQLKIQKTEIELRKMKQEIHESEEVELVMNDMIAFFKAKINALPSKLAPQLVNMGRATDIQEILSEECRLALAELSNYDPNDFFDVKSETNEDEFDG